MRRAFTLIELVTVLLILTITASVGYNVISSASTSSFTQIQQGYLTQVITAEQNFFIQYGTFTPYPSDLKGISLPAEAVTTAVTGPDQIAIAVGATSGDLALAYDNGAHACVLDLVAPSRVATTATSTTTTTLASPSSLTPCTASLALSGETAVSTVYGGTAK